MLLPSSRAARIAAIKAADAPLTERYVAALPQILLQVCSISLSTPCGCDSFVEAG
jgi:hypothetical protein